MYEAMTVQPRQATEARRHDPDSKMGSSAGTPTRMPAMEFALVLHLHDLGRKRSLQMPTQRFHALRHSPVPLRPNFRPPMVPAFGSPDESRPLPRRLPAADAQIPNPLNAGGGPPRPARSPRLGAKCDLTRLAPCRETRMAAMLGLGVMQPEPWPWARGTARPGHWPPGRPCSCLRCGYYSALTAPTGFPRMMRESAAPLHDFALCAEQRDEGLAGAHVCAHENCARPGHHRAPRRPNEPDEPQWLCREHARVWNLNWNYYGRMSTAEIEAARRAALIWDRPTWPAAQAAAGFRKFASRGHPRAWDATGPCAPARNVSESHRRALAILGLRSAATPGDIRNRFKKLLRLLHPDMNAGRHVDATRLRAVIWAWRELRPAGTARTQ